MVAARDEEIVVYLQGVNHFGLGDTWYRVVLGTKVVSKGKRRRGQTISEKEDEWPTISPVAVIPPDYGCNGGWTVIGDDIYWAGGCRDDRSTMEVILHKDLLKHNIHHPDPESWETLCSLTIPRGSPFLTAFGRKIAVLAGQDHRTTTDTDDDNWTKCGEIYDLDTHSLAYLSSDFDPPSYDHADATTVVEDPKKVVFYSLERESVLILDAATGDTHRLVGIVNFFRSQDPEVIPYEDLQPLVIAACSSPAVFHQKTFYWFTCELRLYAYDMVLRQWFRSECLQQQLHPLKPKNPYRPPFHPFLLGLPNENFAVIVSKKRLFTMASFSVIKYDHSGNLGVNVEHIQHFRTDDPFFIPSTGIAMSILQNGSHIMANSDTDIPGRILENWRSCS